MFEAHHFDDHPVDDHLSDDILNEYLDQLIPPAQQQSIENHLIACQECTPRYHALQRLVNDFDQLPELALTHDLTASVLRAIRPPVVMPKLWRWAVVFQVALAGLLLFVSLPLLLESEVIQRLNFFDSHDRLQVELSAWIEEVFDFFTQSSQYVADVIRAFQPTDLPFSFITLLPLLLAVAVLWVVGNGLLLRTK